MGLMYHVFMITCRSEWPNPGVLCCSQLLYIFLKTASYLDERSFNFVVDEVNALSFLAAVQALLGDPERPLRLGEGLLQGRLGSSQRVDLGQHVVRLVLDLGLPVLDVVETVPETPSDVVLGTVGLVVHLATQTTGVQADTLRSRPHLHGDIIIIFIIEYL